MRSYVVKRCLQRGSKHSRRRRTTVSSSRESTTRVSLLRQVGQVSGNLPHGISCGRTYYTSLAVGNAKKGPLEAVPSPSCRRANFFSLDDGRQSVPRYIGRPAPSTGLNQPAEPILNILVPQTGHLPSVAGRPFFIVIWTASLISRLALHLTQYASAANCATSVGPPIPLGAPYSPSCTLLRAPGVMEADMQEPTFESRERIEAARAGRAFEAAARGLWCAGSLEGLRRSLRSDRRHPSSDAVRPPACSPLCRRAGPLRLLHHLRAGLGDRRCGARGSLGGAERRPSGSSAADTALSFRGAIARWPSVSSPPAARCFRPTRPIRWPCHGSSWSVTAW